MQPCFVFQFTIFLVRPFLLDFHPTFSLRVWWSRCVCVVCLNLDLVSWSILCYVAYSVIG